MTKTAAAKTSSRPSPAAAPQATPTRRTPLRTAQPPKPAPKPAADTSARADSGRTPISADSGAATPKTPAPAAPKKSARKERPLVVAGGNDPETARRHLQDLLEAKQERVRQGPTYPASNAHTGRQDADAHAVPASDEHDLHASQGVGSQPSPDALFGSGNVAHARGNQGMRKQR